jgi:hypothetical protein
MSCKCTVQEGGKLAIHKVCLLPVCPYFYIWFWELSTLEFLASTSYLTVILYRITAKYIVVWNMAINYSIFRFTRLVIFFIKLKLFSLIWCRCFFCVLWAFCWIGYRLLLLFPVSRPSVLACISPHLDIFSLIQNDTHMDNCLMKKSARPYRIFF